MAAPSRPAPRGLLIAMAVLAAALLVLATALAVQVRDNQGSQAVASQREAAAEVQQLQDDRAAALDVARQQAVNLTSLTSADFEAGLERIRALSTGAFLADLEQSVAVISDRLEGADFSQSAVLLESGVVRLEDDRASVILALDQVNTRGETSRTDSLRLQVDLQREEGSWLMDNVVFQPSAVALDEPLVPQASPQATGAPSSDPAASPAPGEEGGS